MVRARATRPAASPAYLAIVSSPALRVRQVNVGQPVAQAKPQGRVPTLGAMNPDERYYELSGALDTASSEEINVALDTSVGENTQELEVMLEYVLHEPGQEPRAQGVPIPVLDLR